MGNLLEIDNLISVDNNLNKISEKIQLTILDVRKIGEDLKIKAVLK